MIPLSRSLDANRRLRLKLEFAALFIALPLFCATAVPPERMREVFVAVAVIGVGLLALTPDFRWRGLRGGITRRDAGIVLGFTVLVAVVSAALVLWLAPRQLFALPRQVPVLWAAIMVLYPVLSALPQELIYRVLFYERYGALFADHRSALAVNAVCFGLAHLFYWNWPAVLLTVPGGAIFAWAYTRRSFALACVLHMIAGQILFTMGLGIFFYHGAIGGH